MISPKTPTLELAILIEEHIDKIALSWAEKTYRNASFQPSDEWLKVLYGSTKQGLTAIISALKTGSFTALESYLIKLNHACLRSGFSSGEVTESLLLCKDAIMPVISTYPFNPMALWRVISELDGCFRWIVGHFNTLYTAEMNNHMRKQHEHIISMLKMGTTAPGSVDIDEVLERVAEGIIDAVNVGHCDFYLVDDSQTHLMPRTGISRIPPPKEAVRHFLNRPINLANDIFYRDLLEYKVPQVCHNAQMDSRVDQEMIGLSGAKSVLAVPLVTHDRLLAVAVTGTFDTFRAFTDEQIELAWDVARAAALVLENTRLHQQIRHMAALEERERLAREIHDNLAQALSILKLQTSNIEELLGSGQTELAQKFLTEMKNTATEAHADAREAIFGLRNNSPDASEFVPELRAYLEKYRRLYNLETHLDVQNEADFALPTTVVTQIIRIIQEALANVRKHAKANAVWVRLENHGEEFSITVEDDGQGFDANRVLKKDYGGVGLHIMRERAEGLGGCLKIKAQPGVGTCIVVQIPLQTTVANKGSV